MWTKEELYNPIGCNHHWPSGFSSWHFVSGGEMTGASSSENNVMVCYICGDIKASGKTLWNQGDEPKLQHRYENIFSLYCADTLASVVRNAAYMNEMSVDDFFVRLREEINIQERRDKVLRDNPERAKYFPYKTPEL